MFYPKISNLQNYDKIYIEIKTTKNSLIYKKYNDCSSHNINNEAEIKNKIINFK